MVVFKFFFFFKKKKEKRKKVNGPNSPEDSIYKLINKGFRMSMIYKRRNFCYRDASLIGINI